MIPKLPHKAIAGFDGSTKNAGSRAMTALKEAAKLNERQPIFMHLKHALQTFRLGLVARRGRE